MASELLCRGCVGDVCISLFACRCMSWFVSFAAIPLTCFFTYRILHVYFSHTHIFQQVFTSSTMPLPGAKPEATRTGSVADTHDTQPLVEGSILECHTPAVPAQDSQDAPDTLDLLTQPDSPPKEREDPPQALVLKSGLESLCKAFL